MPWVLDGVTLGDQVLEIGPGPGLVTNLLRARTAHLTCVEIDRALASDLAARTAGTNVTVRCEDASAMTLPDGSMDTALSLTMLHHLPTPARQDRLFADVARVLRPGGMLAGCDTLPSLLIRAIHLFDTFVPVDPAGLPSRLEAAGFRDVRIDLGPREFRFRAVRGSRSR